MLYVRIELWPGGFKQNARLLGEAKIANVNMNEERTQGWYTYRLFGKNGHSLCTGVTHKPFARKRLLAWDLIKLILNEAR